MHIAAAHTLFIATPVSVIRVTRMKAVSVIECLLMICIDTGDRGRGHASPCVASLVVPAPACDRHILVRLHVPAGVLGPRRRPVFSVRGRKIQVRE